MTNSFTLYELKWIINAQNCLAAGLDDVFPLILKHLPESIFNILLPILKKICHRSTVLKSWKALSVIPIPKIGTSNSYFWPIAFLSVFCKVLEHILKNRLDSFFESHNLFPNNMFSFRKGLDKMEYLSSLVDDIYNLFCHKEFCSAVFLDIQDAYNLVHIPILIRKLHVIGIPQKGT